MAFDQFPDTHALRPVSGAQWRARAEKAEAERDAAVGGIDDLSRLRLDALRRASDAEAERDTAREALRTLLDAVEKTATETYRYGGWRANAVKEARALVEGWG